MAEHCDATVAADLYQLDAALSNVWLTLHHCVAVAAAAEAAADELPLPHGDQAEQVGALAGAVTALARTARDDLSTLQSHLQRGLMRQAPHQA